MICWVGFANIAITMHQCAHPPPQYSSLCMMYVMKCVWSREVNLANPFHSQQATHEFFVNSLYSARAIDWMTIIFGPTIISKSYVYCPGGFARHLLQMDLKLGCIESPPQKKAIRKMQFWWIWWLVISGSTHSLHCLSFFFFFLFSPFSGLSSPAFVWHGQFCETQGTCWHAFLQGL